MMRYLGLGVGHRQPADFPREDDKLKRVPAGAFYVTNLECAEGMLRNIILEDEDKSLDVDQSANGDSEGDEDAYEL